MPAVVTDPWLLHTCRCGHTANTHSSTAVCTKCLCTDFLPDLDRYPIGACITS